MQTIGARLAAIGMVLALVLGACTGGDQAPAPASTPPAPATPGASAAPTAPAASPSASPAGTATPAASGGTASASVPPAGRPDLAAVRLGLDTVATGLDGPLFATDAGDGTGRLFVVEQGGTVQIVRDGRLLDAPFLDLTDRVLAGGERGLLGLAFAPGFGRDGEDRLYVHYSNRDGDTTIAELRAPGGADTVDPAAERVLLVEPQPYANHNGGWIGFDPTGMLLVALGDGGSAGDPQDRAERLDTLLGKILRIDVLAGADGYVVPPDNPFVDRSGARPEILHLGLRNPWRTSLDPATGDLWIADVGQSSWEEVDVARAGQAGLDFGWNTLEGRHCFDPPSGCDAAGRTPPVAEYPHADGCSIVGGYVYRGAAIPALVGAYLFSDYCSGTVWAIDAADDAAEPVTLLETGRTIGSFGRDEAGELYLLDLAGGELLRLAQG